MPFDQAAAAYRFPSKKARTSEGWLVWLVWLVWLLWFVWLIWLVGQPKETK
jgi:hypothetical protein